MGKGEWEKEERWRGIEKDREGIEETGKRNKGEEDRVGIGESGNKRMRGRDGGNKRKRSEREWE